MKENKTIFGVIAIIISQVLVKILGLVYKLYLANKTGFGDVGNAIYNSGYQIYALLLIISTIGVPSAVAKVIAEQREAKDRAVILKTSIAIFSIIGIIGTVGLYLCSNFIASTVLDIPEAKYSIIALSPAVFNVCLISVYRGYFNGLKQISLTAKSQTIEQLLKTIATIVFVEIAYIVSCSNITYMAAFANFATTIATMCCLIYLSKKGKHEFKKGKISIKSAYRIISIALPISVSAILASLNKNIDSVMVVRFLKAYMNEENARRQYGILSGKVEVISALPISFVIAIATTIIPTVALYNRNKNYSVIRDMVVKYTKYTIIFVLPCSMCMFIFSDEILNLFFGSTSGSIYLKICSVGIFFISMEQIINSVLQGIGKVYIPPIALGLGVLVKFLLNVKVLKLDPSKYWFGGVTGVCIATLVCHIIVFFVTFIALKNELKIKFKNFKIVLKALCASCIMAMCWYYTYFLLKGIIIKKLAIILAGIIAIVIYFASIYLLRLFSDNELSLIYEDVLHKNIEKNKKNKKK